MIEEIEENNSIDEKPLLREKLLRERLSLIIEAKTLKAFKIKCLQTGQEYSSVVEKLMWNSMNFKKKNVWKKE